MVIDATGVGAGGVTVTPDVAALPSTVAVTDALPAAAPLTRPVADTVATLALDELQLTGRLVSTLPAASRAVSVRVVVSPTPKLTDVGESDTDATGTFCTVTALVPLRVPLAAFTDAEPNERPDTVPPASTEATAGAVELHTTFCPESRMPN